jgi:hypothetical protein
VRFLPRARVYEAESALRPEALLQKLGGGLSRSKWMVGTAAEGSWFGLVQPDPEREVDRIVLERLPLSGAVPDLVADLEVSASAQGSRVRLRAGGNLVEGLATFMAWLIPATLLLTGIATRTWGVGAAAFVVVGLELYVERRLRDRRDAEVRRFLEPLVGAPLKRLG